jgi:hypothetical protein
MWMATATWMRWWSNAAAAAQTVWLNNGLGNFGAAADSFGAGGMVVMQVALGM